MAYEVSVETVEPQATVVARGRSKSSEFGQVMPELFGRLGSGLAASKLTPSGPNRGFFQEVEPGVFDVEVGVPVDGAAEIGGDLHRSQTPGGRVAKVVHLSGWEGLAQAHEAIHAWFERSGERRAGPFWEVWHDDSGEGGKAEIYYLLET
jgi:effector-binding domain-containing protein